jgi:opacity protein-like surface antigen
MGQFMVPRRRGRWVLVVGCALAVSAANVSADEYLWVYARGADTLPDGAFEIKASDIWRHDKDSGDYSFHDLRSEIEYGATDRLTLSAEVLVFHHDYSVDDPELNPMFETQGGAGERFRDTQYAGFELGMKYNVLSNYKDPIGLAFALGYERREKYRLDGADIDQDSFTITTFLQKNFLDDTLYVVLTPKVEFERRKSPGVLEEEIAFDVAAGLAYRIVPNWFVGLEFRHQSDYLNPQVDGEFNPELERSSFDLGDFRLGSQHQRGNYLGPTLHYSHRNWWATAGVLWQVRGGGSPFSYSRDHRNYDEHEKVHVGLTVGWET